MTVFLDNPTARRVFLDQQGLSAHPGRALSRAGLGDLVHRIGFVQVDSVQTVERAHHQILFSRNQTYDRAHLTHLLEKERLFFEHWTHDASIIPARFFPYWKHRFRRKEPQIRANWLKWQGEAFEAAADEVLAHVRENGPVLSREMKAEPTRSTGWWDWHPSKTALEFLWHTGKLAIAGREGFQKIYDLTERVIPEPYHSAEVSETAFLDWAARSALERLGFATPGEIAAFYALISPEEARQWLAENRDALEEVLIEPADGDRPRPAFAFAGFGSRIEAHPEPPQRLRVLSPFDPLIRDRNRCERLFGFRYRIEIFVPEPKREYGYYVFPLLEGDRLIGRIDMKADRRRGTLDVKRLWLEPGIRPSTGRLEKLDAELNRLARFTGVERVVYLVGWRG